jgi:transcriptional regulator with XRE-family HTH domain
MGIAIGENVDKERLKYFQATIGLTNEQLGTLCGVSLRAVEKWRQGANKIPRYVEILFICIKDKKSAEELLVELKEDICSR